ncbi:hypothetical protein AB6A40_011417, partial [Gnathostoma spinigerum]
MYPSILVAQQLCDTLPCFLVLFYFIRPSIGILDEYLLQQCTFSIDTFTESFNKTPIVLSAKAINVYVDPQDSAYQAADLLVKRIIKGQE